LRKVLPKLSAHHLLYLPKQKQQFMEILKFPDNPNFSPRQWEVLRLIAETDGTHAQIAEWLNPVISPATVKRHEETLRQILGVDSRCKLMIFWYKNIVKH
jgi:DNA-binding NarL/FixJ family response regulator